MQKNAHTLKFAEDLLVIAGPLRNFAGAFTRNTML